MFFPDYYAPAPGMAPETPYAGMQMYSGMPMDKNYARPPQQAPSMATPAEMNNGAVQGEKAPGMNMNHENPMMYGQQFNIPYMYQSFPNMYNSYPYVMMMMNIIIIIIMNSSHG